MSNANSPAMPVHEIISACSVDGNSGPYDFSVVHAGLTKREQFAMAAMQGLLAKHGDDDYSPASIAEYAVKHAECLLAELEK